MGCEGNIRAISRGLEVLQVINQHRSVSMMSIARQCAIPYPTACRIVDTLIEEGMIERETTRKHYRPTALVKTLSVGYQQDDHLARVSRPHIRDLTREVRWPISVCVRVGMTMMIRESTHAFAPFTFNVYHPGYTMPLLGSSSGKAFLAFCGADDREVVFEQVRRMSAPNAARATAGLEAELKTIKDRGYSTYDRIRHTANPGKTSAISVPVLADDLLEGTLTLAFFCSTMTLHQAVQTYAPALKRAAADIGRELAAIPPPEAVGAFSNQSNMPPYLKK